MLSDILIIIKHFEHCINGFNIPSKIIFQNEETKILILIKQVK